MDPTADKPSPQHHRQGNVVHPVDVEASQTLVQNHITVKCFAWLVPLIVVANMGVFFYTMYVNNCPKYSGLCVAGFLGRFSFQPTEENPMFGPSTYTLRKVGAQDVDLIVNSHEWWRLFTSVWLHSGVIHVLSNMTVLILFGIRLEQEFGFVRVGLLYLITGYGGNLLSALFIRDVISVGASGAVFGIIGGMLSELIMNWSKYTHKVAALLFLLIFSIANLASSHFFPHIDNFAHIGGFVSGILLGFVLLIRPQLGWVSQQNGCHGPLPNSRIPKFKVYQKVLRVLSLVLVIVGLAAATALVLYGYGADHKRCQATKTEDQLTLTCSKNITRTYTITLPNPNTSPIQLQGLCNKLCS